MESSEGEGPHPHTSDQHYTPLWKEDRCKSRNTYDATLGEQSLCEKSNQSSVSKVRVRMELAPCDHVCTTCEEPLEGKEDIPCFALHSKGIELIWTMCTMSHYFKKKPHSWHLEHVWLPLSNLSHSNDPQAEKHSSHPQSVFSFPFCIIFHSPKLRDAKALNIKREMEALDVNGEI